MRRAARPLIFVLAFACGRAQAAEAYRRHVSFEWEPVADAQGYEIELKPVVGAKQTAPTYHFKPKLALWSGKLVVGRYQLRARTLDDRAVPGAWGAASPFDVLLDATKLLSPVPGAVLPPASEVEFHWAPVGGARAYRIRVNGADGQTKIDESTDGTELRRPLAGPGRFLWSVNAEGANGLPSEPNADVPFSVQGPKLATPSIERPVSAFVRALKWKNGPQAEGAAVRLARSLPPSTSWETVYSSDDRKEEGLPFQAELSGGIYRLTVVAKADLHPDSDPATVDFAVADGDRSEAREQAERARRWYAVAGLSAADLRYSAQNYDQALAAQISFAALARNLRVGLGYVPAQGDWSFACVADLAQMSASGQALTSTSGEASGVWRSEISDRAEVRLQAGLFYKQFIVAESNSVATTVASYSKASVLGPAVGAELRYGLTPTLGFRGGLRLFESLVALEASPSGNDRASLSPEVDFLGSYRSSARSTWVAGVLQRNDQLTFDSSSPVARLNGQKNSVTVVGTYFTLALEYKF